MYDRFMDTQTGIQKEQLQLIGVTCLFIASKIEVGSQQFVLSSPLSFMSFMVVYVKPQSAQTYKLVCTANTHMFTMPNEVGFNNLSLSLSLSLILGNLPTKGIRICLRHRWCLHSLQHSRHWAHHLQGGSWARYTYTPKHWVFYLEPCIRSINCPPFGFSFV